MIDTRPDDPLVLAQPGTQLLDTRFRGNERRSAASFNSDRQ